MEEYDRKVVECIQYLCDCEELGRDEKLSFFKKARRALGQTAMMLSGGGAIAMYHAGVMRGRCVWMLDGGGCLVGPRSSTYHHRCRQHTTPHTTHSAHQRGALPVRARVGGRVSVPAIALPSRSHGTD